MTEAAEDTRLLNEYNASLANKSSQSPMIVAIGIGGGGGNAIKYMCTQNIQGVQFMAMNTDRQALDDCPAHTKLLLGPKLCKGRGAGGRAEAGCEAAEESIPQIKELLSKETDMVFITAGMGGGTGTGASPVVAKVCKDQDLLTVGIVTIPFFFEGLDKLHGAMEGAAKLKKNVDALLVINNERLGEIYPDMEWSEAFTKADDILATAARSISEIVTNRSVINLDMRDVRNCLTDGKTAFISVGYAEGENRMSKAIENALHSPLLCDTNISTARKMIFSFYISHDIDPPLKMAESNQVNQLVKSMNSHVWTKFGWGYDDTLGNKIKFTILAAGFDVTVEHSGGNALIEGNHEGEEAPAQPIEKDIVQAYGRDKIEDLLRHQETQNYYVLTPAQLDSDEAIRQLESTPAYRRDKGKIARQQARAESRPKTNPNEINFSLDDR